MLCSTSDYKFTLLPFTSALSKAVCCVVIFQQKNSEVPEIWQAGQDLQVPPVKRDNNSMNIAASKSPGKHFPGGPTCTLNGKTITCMAFASKHG